MAQFDIRSKSGEQFTIGGQITKPLTAGAPPPWPNYPAIATNFTCVFTAKRSKSDTSALVTHNATLQDGGAWLLTIVPADTSSFTRAEELAFDVVLNEPGGAKTVVCEGTWFVEKSVGL
jgi:hypothetical protein